MASALPTSESPGAAVEAAQSLLDCLQREYTALTGQDPAAIEAIVREKHDRLSRLETALHRPAPGTQTAPAGLTALLAECERHNRINGNIIEVSRQHVQRALALVRGQNPEPALYGPQGDARHGTDSRSLARA